MGYRFGIRPFGIDRKPCSLTQHCGVGGAAWLETVCKLSTLRPRRAKQATSLCLAFCNTGAPTVERFGSRFTPGDKIIQLVNPMRERNLLYTAVTRGKHLVVVIGQPQALAMAVNTVKAARRLTGLAQRLSR